MKTGKNNLTYKKKATMADYKCADNSMGPCDI